MALTQRPAARFFAAFYRWSCYTRPPACRRRSSSVAAHALSPLGQLEASHAANRGTPTALPDENTALPDENTALPDENTALAGEHTAVLPDESTAPPPRKHASMKTGIRSLMRTVPSSVVIITVHALDAATSKPLPLGSAISSLNTVTLDPPHISFNIKTPSRTLDAIHAARGRFRVHFLESGLAAARIAESFTNGNSPEVLKKRARLMSWFFPTARHLAGATDSLAPQLRTSAVVASMECELMQEARVADHVVAIARVHDFRSRHELVPPLLYHQGAYKNYDGSVIQQHQRQASPGDVTEHAANNVYFSYPLFPGPVEKEDFTHRLKEYIKQDQEVLRGSSFDGARVLRRKWRIPAGAFGISTVHLVGQVKKELGMKELGKKSAITEATMDLPVTRRFYERLSTADIAIIADRAKQLVRANPMVLAMHPTTFFALLDVHHMCTGLLASDILEPLRKEGLVAPFVPHAVTPGRERDSGSLEVLEQIEYALREFMKNVPYQTMFKMRAADVQVAGVEMQFVETYIKRVRPRITTEVYPALFSPPAVDIMGHVGPEESRVIVARIIRYLDVKDSRRMPIKMGEPKTELLRQVGVHPMVSGINFEFLFGKLYYIMHQASDWGDIKASVEDMLEPLFTKKTLAWADFNDRLRKLVQSHTLQVMEWTREDILAAMGIDHRATIQTPLSANRPHLLHGNILPTLIAKELKLRYYNETSAPEEKDAIVRYLKTRHGHDLGPALGPAPGPLFSSVEYDKEAYQQAMREFNMRLTDEAQAKHVLEEAFDQFPVGLKIRTVPGRL